MSIREHDDLELMSLRRLNDSLEATRTMLRQAQRLAQESQAALVGLASEFCASELQKRQEKNADLSLLPPEDLAALLRACLKTLKLASANSATNQLAEANRLIGELRADLETQRGRAERAQVQVEQFGNQVQALERTLENERQARREAQAQATPVPGGSHPLVDEHAAYQTWCAAWKVENRSWERDCSVIRTIGKSGLSLSTELEAAMARECEISTRTAHRALLDCVQAGLLEQQTITTLDGRPPQSYTLTDRGRWLYRELTGEQPGIQERQQLLMVHKSERHLALILKTAEFFSHLGFIVDREPLRLEIEPNRSFQPDLVIRYEDKTFYLEVETGEKEKASHDQKWENALAASGRICVVTDNMNTLRRVQGSIAQWSRFEGRSVTLHITCLATLKEKKPGESPWYALKEYAPG